MSKRRREGGFLSGLVFGLMAGAGLFHYLTKTQEGKKIKAKLVKKGQDALNGLVDVVADFEEKGEEFKKKAKKLQDDLEKKTQGVKEEVAKEAKQQLVEVEELRKRGQEAAQRFFKKDGQSLAKKKTPKSQ